MTQTTSNIERDGSRSRFALASFVVVILVAMAIATYGATYVLVRDMSDLMQEDFGSEAKRRIGEHLDQLFSGKIAALGDQAALGVLVNSVMHPPQNPASLDDYLSQLQLLGEKANYTLLGFDGGVIATSSKAIFKSLQERWITAIIDGEMPSHAEVLARADDENFDALYAVPVLYHGNQEGILIAQQPYNSSLTATALEHRKAPFVAEFIGSQNDLVGRIGIAPPEHFTKLLLDVPHLKTPVYLYVDQDSASQALGTILWIVFGITVGLVILFLLVFQRLGLRLFIEPQQRLEAVKNQVESVNSRLTRANDELSQFAYRTSHDLRAPLTTIKGLAKFALEDLKENQLDDVEANIGRIQVHAERLDKLAGDILDLSRADFLDGKPKEIDLEEMCQDISQKLSEIYAHNVDIRCNTSVEEPLRSQPIRIYQILQNLVSNAVKYHNPDVRNSFVRIFATQKDEDYFITVEDNGLGIPAERQPEVFEMFKRFHPGISTGSGLGMSIIQKHVEQLGGKIGFESSCDGTTFRIRLPKSGGQPWSGHAVDQVSSAG